MSLYSSSDPGLAVFTGGRNPHSPLKSITALPFSPPSEVNIPADKTPLGFLPFSTSQVQIPFHRIVNHPGIDRNLLSSVLGSAQRILHVDRNGDIEVIGFHYFEISGPIHHSLVKWYIFRAPSSLLFGPFKILYHK